MTDMDPTMATSMLADLVKQGEHQTRENNMLRLRIDALRAALWHEGWELRSQGKDCCAQRVEQIRVRLS